MLAASPNNARPSWLHVRECSMVVTNSFPEQPKERREPFVKTWARKGPPYRFFYAVLIHDLPADELLDCTAAYRRALDRLKRG